MKNKSRKSKKLLVVVAVILMLGLVVGMGAMTYSKYVTSGSTAQTATAAKWGFVVNVNATNLFGTEYKKDGTNATAKVDGSGDVVVKGTSSAIVVAPGTEGSLTFSISGTAEVLAKITVTATGSEIHLDNYYPIKWTLKKDGAVVEGGENKKLSEIITLINTTATTIQPGDPATNAGSYELSWKWALEVDETSNAKDTIIGYKALDKTYAEIENLYSNNTRLGGVIPSADYDDANKVSTSISFNLTISVEQVQE